MGSGGIGLHAGRLGVADAAQQLDRLILDQSQPAIARASALASLAPHVTPASEPAIKAAIVDSSPLVRWAAPRAVPASPPPAVTQAVAPLLSDPVRAVRIEAARALAGTDLLALTPERQTAFVKAGYTNGQAAGDRLPLSSGVSARRSASLLT